MNVTEFEKAVQSEVKRAANITAIWANQTRARPARPFVELSLTDITPESQHSELTVEDGATFVTLNAIQHLGVRVEMRVFSGEVTGEGRAINIGRKIVSHFGKESSINALFNRLESIALYEAESVKDASIVLETEYEGRATCALHFRVASVTGEQNEFIEETTYEVKTVDENLNQTTTTIVVP